MIKVALIGIGGMGNVHFNSYKSIKNCKVIAVADVRREMAIEKVNDSSIHVYSTLTELLGNESPDMVDICTPSYLHTEMTTQALAAGMHVLCEKPIALCVKDAEIVKEACEKSGKLFMTAHVVRFMNDYIYLHNIIKSGELGKLIRLDMKRISAIPRWSWENWMMDISKSGGTPIDLGIHDIDYIQSIFGKDPDKYNSVYKKLENNNDYFLSTMQFGDTVITTETAWYNADIKFMASYRAVFQNGFIECNNGDIIKDGEKIDLIGESTQKQNIGLNISASDGYLGEIEYFLSCIEQNTPPQIVNPESTLNTMKLIETLVSNALSA